MWPGRVVTSSVQLGKPAAPVLSMNTMGPLPALSPGLGLPGKMTKPTSTAPALWPVLPEAQYSGEAHPVLHTQEVTPVCHLWH